MPPRQGRGVRYVSASGCEPSSSSFSNQSLDAPDLFIGRRPSKRASHSNAQDGQPNPVPLSSVQVCPCSISFTTYICSGLRTSGVVLENIAVLGSDYLRTKRPFGSHYMRMSADYLRRAHLVENDAEHAFRGA